METYYKNLGKVTLTTGGNWNINNAYERITVVYDELRQMSFIAKQDVPVGIPTSNEKYWQPIGAGKYGSDDVINLSYLDENDKLITYTLEEAIAAVDPDKRRVGLIITFYQHSKDKLFVPSWTIWQFTSTCVDDWFNTNAWFPVYYNRLKFVGWFESEATLKAEFPIPYPGSYAYVGVDYETTTIWRCKEYGVWYDSGVKYKDFYEVVISGDIDINEEGNWIINGIDTGVSAKGIPAGFGTTDATVEMIEEGSLPSCVVTTDGPDTAKNFHFAFKLPFAGPRKYTFAINPTPSDATVTINGQQVNSVRVEEGTEITWSVSKSGYRTQSGTYTVTSDYTMNVSLVEVTYCTLTVTAVPSDATIRINSSTRNTITVPQGEQVYVSVSKTGYVTKTQYVIVNEINQTLTVTLEESQNWIFKLYVNSPENCTVKVQGVTRPGVNATTPYETDYEDGTYVRWEVSKEGYLTQSNRFYIHDDTELHITLEVEPEPTAQIIARCLEGEEQIEGMGYVAFNNDNPTAVYDSINLTADETALLYGVAGEGYEFVAWQDAANPTLVYTQNPLTVTAVNNSGELTDKEYVILVKVKEEPEPDPEPEPEPEPTQYTLTINPTPVDATVKINNTEQTSITVDENTKISYEVSKTGYITKSDTYTVTKTETLNIVLEEETPDPGPEPEPTLEVSPTSLEFDYKGGTKEITITSDQSWTIE